MPAFQFSNTKRFRKLGLEGDLCWAMMHENALQLQDDANHVVRLAPSNVERIRVGYFDDRRRRNYNLRVWVDLEQKPLEMIPTNATWVGYRETVYGFAQLMKDTNHLARVETGSTKFDAVFGPILAGIPTLAAIAISAFVLTNEPWWGRMIVPLVPTVIFVILIWFGVNRYWPRTISDAVELKRHLPPGSSHRSA